MVNLRNQNQEEASKKEISLFFAQLKLHDDESDADITSSTSSFSFSSGLSTSSQPQDRPLADRGPRGANEGDEKPRRLPGGVSQYEGERSSGRGRGLRKSSDETTATLGEVNLLRMKTRHFPTSREGK